MTKFSGWLRHWLFLISFLRQFSITLVSPARAERTFESIRLSVRFGARGHAMEVETFSTSMAFPRAPMLREVLCMYFLAHALTSSLRPRGQNWCNGESLLSQRVESGTLIISIREEVKLQGRGPRNTFRPPPKNIRAIILQNVL